MSSFSPTQAELTLVNSIFTIADPQKLGIVTGDKAVEAFAGANLPPAILGEIWSIADKDNNGFLTRKGVAVALRLIGHAQKGEQVKESLIDRPGLLAFIEGISTLSPRHSSIPSSPPPKSPPPGGTLYPPLTAEDKSKFLRLFLGCGPANGLLNGDKARDVFVKSKLPFEKLSQIWTLADTQDRGSLDQTDFTIAMYLIQAIMSGQLANLPATLPPGLYEQAGGRVSTGVISHGTGNSIPSLSPSLTGSFAPPITTPTSLAAQTTGTGPRRLQPQTTGQEYNRLSMAMPNQHHHPSVHFAPNPVTALGASAFGAPPRLWDVTPEEKTRFDQFFDGLDTQKRDFIEGDVAVPFMLQSKLSEDVLAQVWDLADLNNDGRLTRDGFAVAMHLIQGKLAGKDIPTTLPMSLIPPTMRAARSAGTAPAYGLATVPEPVRDLLWDDSPPVSATALQQPSSAVASPPPSQATPILQPQTTEHLSQQQTGAGTPKPPAILARMTDPFGVSPFAPPVHRDLLSDDEGTTPASVPDNSAEIGNLQNQVSSTSRSLESTKTERHITEASLTTQASQLSALQTQLSSAKAAYETETRLLGTLRERFAAQSADIVQTREQLIRAESELSGVRVEKAEIEGSLLRDKEEVRELQRRMKEVGEEAERMKAAIEKAKKETKHQKGLLAIAKKQLATREAERAKVAKDLEDAERETHETLEELETTEAELAKEPVSVQANGITSPTSTASEPLGSDTLSFAAAQPLPASPSMSPPLSVNSPPSTKTNNPFERLVMQSTGSRPASPFSATAVDIFSTPTPPMQTEPVSATPFTPLATPATARTSSPHAVAAEPSSSTTAPSSAADDPFGLTDRDKESSATSVAESLEKSASPTPDVVTGFGETEPQAISSTGTTETDTINIPKIPKETPSPSTAFNDAADQFPAVDTQIPGGFPTADDTVVGQTDLDSKLVEKEEEQSDSDTDSENEGDFHDAKEARTSIGSPVDEQAKMSSAGAMGNGFGLAHTANSNAFEDAFGLKESTPKADTSVTGLPATKDPIGDLFFSAPESVDKTPVNGKLPESGSPFDSIPTAISGVSAFDEAMGKISPPSASSAAPQFQLDSTFEDNFDFTAAKAELQPLASPFPPTPAVNGSSQGIVNASVDFGSPFAHASTSLGTASKPQEGSKNGFSFDDAFGSVSPSQVASQPSAGDHGISFEDAFGGGGNKALALEFNAPAPSPSTTTEPRQPEAEPAALSSVHTPPRSPKAVAMPASPSTIRSATPPPRRSTGSSVEGTASAKSPPPQRHSKLSIRLPFGRKDKKKSKHEPPPVPPPQFLSPVAEPVEGAGTPAVEDDVEPVKQLCGMGFSRTQAVAALEKHGYDVQRALNSLLGGA